ncbi:MAG: DUF2490 domain-containing protein [Niabella sp.]
MVKKLYIFLFLFISCATSAQTRHEQTGWFFFLNNTKFNDRWGLQFDFQLRSHDDLDGARNILVRPGITYYLKTNQNITAGYLYNPTFSKADNGGTITHTEHRIWEQYILTHKLFTGVFAHRARLEQRFIEKVNKDKVFAQRFRYFFRDVQPLKKQEGAFIKGPFAALQNEVFLNVQYKENTNAHFFDQNRAYIAMGYRLSKKLDIEAGYMNQYIKGAGSNTLNNIAQLAVYTRF